MDNDLIFPIGPNGFSDIKVAQIIDDFLRRDYFVVESGELTKFLGMSPGSRPRHFIRVQKLPDGRDKTIVLRVPDCEATNG